MVNPNPSSFFEAGVQNPNQVPAPSPASFYTVTAAFNLIYYGALQAAPTTDPFGNSILVGAMYYDLIKQSTYLWNGTTWNPIPFSTTTLDVVVAGTGGGVISSGLVIYRVVPFNAAVTGWTLLADVSGSIQIDVQSCTYANFNPPTHPASGDTIAPVNKPTLTSQIKNQLLSGLNWTNISAGSVLAIAVTSATTVHQISLQLNLQRL